MNFQNKIAFTQDQLDYADYIINGKKLDQKTALSFISHKFKLVGLDAYALYVAVKRD